MTVVNLIPAHRIHKKRLRNRTRTWACIVGGCALTAIGAHFWLHTTWQDDSQALQAAIDRADATIRDLERQVLQNSAALSEAQATLRARRAVGDQPDWGLLLATIAARLDQQAVLSGCVLEPAGQSAPGTRSSRNENQRRIRPSKYTLSLTGLTRTQDAASSIAIALERTGIFDHVTLLEATRSGFLGEEAVTFRLECALADPAAEVQ